MRPEAVLAKAGLPAARLEPLAGGDIGRVYRAGAWVVKTHPAPPPGLFEAEATGLRALAQAGVRVPRVRWVGAEGMVLEYLPPGRPDWPGLAAMLAELHRHRGAAYGWDRTVYLGTFPLPAGFGQVWRAFWRERRVQPLLEATWDRLGGVGRRVERWLEAFDPPVEGPVLLHGDLWSGNVHMSAAGPALLDPSVWWGERGVDLAMMRLFGGFPEAFWRAYQARYPIPEAVEAALPFYQVYYLLVHVHFFGAGYVGALERLLRRAGV